MEHFFKTVHITNFKSLKDVTLSDCKRINLLLGKPNVGKSNILEAIGLFSLPYFKYNKSNKINQFIRLENLPELFFDGNVDEKITVHIDDNNFYTSEYLQGQVYSSQEGVVQFEMNLKGKKTAFELPLGVGTSNEIIENYQIMVDNNFNLWRKNRGYFYPLVKYYKFPYEFVSKKQTIKQSYLIPPTGVNLIDAIQESRITKELSNIFGKYNLKLLFDKTNNTLRIMKLLKDEDSIVSFPLSSIADTLQRLIFFKTAIASNKDSIILFEEPEAHCFPPYITHIAKEIINSETNQFFIATHSPYILDTFLENARDELAIYMADFKDGQTVIKRLSDAEVNEVYDYGLDLFFNAELFTDEIQH